MRKQFYKAVAKFPLYLEYPMLDQPKQIQKGQTVYLTEKQLDYFLRLRVLEDDFQVEEMTFLGSV